MTSSFRRSMALLAMSAGLLAQGCELPSAQDGGTPVRLSLQRTGPITIRKRNTVVVEVRDAEGRLVADPGIRWRFTDNSGSTSTGLVEVVDTSGTQAVVVGLHPGVVRITAGIDDPRFTSEPVTEVDTVQYSPMKVSFIGVGSDTVLTSRGDFYLRARAVDQGGQYVPDGDWVVTTRGTSVGVEYRSPGDSIVPLRASGIGPDTVFLTHTMCPNACGDTLAVSVAPIATSIALAGSWCSTSLGDSVQLQGTAEDTAGWEVPAATLTWRLADPADTVVLALTDSSTGAAISRTNGTARVVASTGNLEVSHDFTVSQGVGIVKRWAPEYIVGAGTSFTVSFDPFDANGNPLPPSLPVLGVWIVWTGNTGAGWSSDARETQSVAPDYGSYSLTVDASNVVCNGPDVARASAGGPLRVIHEPDSVAAYPEAGSTTLNGIGSTATWLGNIYLPGETISAAQLSWSSLDPTVATIDLDGLVTAVSAGTARIVGTMGAAADTAVVTVTG